MKKDVKVYLDDIFESIKRIEKYTKGLTKADYEADFELQDAVSMRFAIIGEAVKHIPQDFRKKYPQIPWKDIAGMRDKLIHNYDEAEIEIIWRTIEEDFKSFKKQIKELLKLLED